LIVVATAYLLGVMSQRLGMTPELRRWVCQAQVDADQRPGGVDGARDPRA